MGLKQDPQTHESKLNLKHHQDEGNKELILERYHLPHTFACT